MRKWFPLILLLLSPLALGQVTEPEIMIRADIAVVLEAEECETGSVARATDTGQWYDCIGRDWIPSSVRTCPESPPSSSCDVDHDDDGTDDKAQVCVELEDGGTPWFCDAGSWVAMSVDTLGGHDHSKYLRRDEDNATITGTGWSFTASAPQDVDFLNLALTGDHDGLCFYDDFVSTETVFCFKNSSGVFYLTSDADALDKFELGDGTNVIDFQVYGSHVGDGSSEIKFDPDYDLTDESKITANGSFTGNADGIDGDQDGTPEISIDGTGVEFDSNDDATTDLTLRNDRIDARGPFYFRTGGAATDYLYFIGRRWSLDFDDTVVTGNEEFGIGDGDPSGTTIPWAGGNATHNASPVTFATAHYKFNILGTSHEWFGGFKIDMTNVAYGTGDVVISPYRPKWPGGGQGSGGAYVGTTTDRWDGMGADEYCFAGFCLCPHTCGTRECLRIDFAGNCTQYDAVDVCASATVGIDPDCDGTVD